MEQTDSQEKQCPRCRHKRTPRTAAEQRQLCNRLHRMMGQLHGIEAMIGENRYCGDILTQIAAVESALQSFGYRILEEHMQTCVAEQLRDGSTTVIPETTELIRKLK